MYVSYIMELSISHFISNTLENQWFDVQPIVCSFQSSIAISFIHTVNIATCFSYLYATFRLWVLEKWYKTCVINHVLRMSSTTKTELSDSLKKCKRQSMWAMHADKEIQASVSYWRTVTEPFWKNDKASIYTELAGKMFLRFSFDSSS